ncbi:MAG: hypothetical protein IPN77_09685 [Sandaracinaceae bacterium]|nr:hypothetical protein [Sandaracinaceae bacterium]
MKPHPLFTREGADVLLEVPISFPQAVLGAQIDMPTIEAAWPMKIRRAPVGPLVPPARQGIGLRRRRQGDQLVRVIVEVPEHLPQAAQAHQELAEELGWLPPAAGRLHGQAARPAGVSRRARGAACRSRAGQRALAHAREGR